MKQPNQRAAVPYAWWSWEFAGNRLAGLTGVNSLGPIRTVTIASTRAGRTTELSIGRE